MEVSTRDIWNTYYNEIYFFILKKINNSDASQEILQNSFLKIHKNLDRLKDATKLKSWVFQIVRNEVINYHHNNRQYENCSPDHLTSHTQTEPLQELCCFDHFVKELPEQYREVVQLVYFEGKKQGEVAAQLHMSLANVKALIRRAKSQLKEKFNTCCKFSFDVHGKLVGEPNCQRCTP